MPCKDFEAVYIYKIRITAKDERGKVWFFEKYGTIDTFGSRFPHRSAVYEKKKASPVSNRAGK